MLIKNNSGKLGEPELKPKKFDLSFLNNKKIKKVVCGANHTVLLAGKSVYAWGNKESGQTGYDILKPDEAALNLDKEENKFDHMKPNKIGPDTVKDIFTGREHSFMLVQSSGNKTQLKGWGLNNFGQLGIGNNESTNLPITNSFFNNKKIKSLTGGDFHTLVLLQNNELYAFGRNDEGQCGIMSEEKKEETLIISKPSLVSFETEKIDEATNNKKQVNLIESINTSMNFNYAKSKSNCVFSWGFGESLVLGNLKDSNELIPYKIKEDFFLNKTIEDVIKKFLF